MLLAIIDEKLRQITDFMSGMLMVLYPSDSALFCHPEKLMTDEKLDTDHCLLITKFQ